AFRGLMRKRALAERFQHAGNLVFRNAGSSVFHAEILATERSPPDGHGDGAARGGELYGVRQEIEADLAHGALIDPKLRQRRIKILNDLEALVLGAAPHQPVAIHDDVGEGHGPLVQLITAGLDAADVENLVDEIEQMLAALMDVVGVFGGVGLLCGPKICARMMSEKPTMALSGVRSSWLIVARKRDLAKFASSARARASSEIDSACSSSAISASFSARNSSMVVTVAWK